MHYLKQSTSVDVRLGPFVDATDGVTPETGVTLGAADQAEALKHDGAATVDISSNTWAAVTGCDGWYDLTLTTTDTNTLGQLTIVVQDSSVCLPVFKDFMVVPANTYDSLVGGTDYLQTDAVQVEGVDATDQINAACDASMVTYGLDHLVSAAVTGTDVADNSVIAKMVASGATADWDTFVNTTDSLQAARDKLTDIETDTAEIGAAGAGLTAINLPDQTMNITGNITGNLSGSIGSLGATAKSDVNAEVVDALATDTYAEPGQEAPAATNTLAAKIGYIFKFMRNKIETTSTQISVYDDAGTTVDQKSTISDSAGTFTRGEFGSGP